MFALTKQYLLSPLGFIKMTFGINAVMLEKRCSRSATCLYNAAFLMAIDAIAETVLKNEKSE